MEVNNNCTVGYPVSQPEMKPENPSKCSQGTLVTAVGSSKTNANVNQLEIECTVPEGEAKVVLYIYSKIINIMCIFLHYVYF